MRDGTESASCALNVSLNLPSGPTQVSTFSPSQLPVTFIPGCDEKPNTAAGTLRCMTI